jgi:cell pole-organizing protein PopZ
MEEILASIRRIIADDEAKPAEKPAAAAAPAPAAPSPAKPAMKDIPPSTIPAAQAAAKAAAPAPKPAPPAPPPPAPPPAAVASNSQDDIDAMLASLEADTAVEEAPEPEPEADVFELTDEMALPDPPPPPAPPPAAAFNKIDPQDDLEFTEAKAAQRQPAPEPLRLEMPMPPILSRTTVNAVESAFNTLAHTVLSNNARTLEDLVKEMLRPMLKSWLDDNLPGLVERIVKAEIERVSRGR